MDAGAPSSELPGVTTYVHGSRQRVGKRDEPQVTPQDREIEVRTAWGPLLREEPNVRVRPEESVEAAAYAAGATLLIVEKLFSSSECMRLIDAAEAIGFGKTNYPKQYRGNLRLITVDQSLAETVWLRLRPLVPLSIEFEGHTWHACGLNECWRLAKYLPGDRFGKHCDAWFERNERECSFYTVNVYMNTVPREHGGATRFFDSNQQRGQEDPPTLSVQPEAGLSVVFRQPPGADLLHDGEELREGTKFLFRSDVMYRRA